MVIGGVLVFHTSPATNPILGVTTLESVGIIIDPANKTFKRLPGRLSLDIVSDYMCPAKPAIADGRLFVRALDKLVCYDLLKGED